MARDICSSCYHSWWHGQDQELKCEKRLTPKTNSAGAAYCLKKLRATGSDDDIDNDHFLDNLEAYSIELL